MARGDATNVQVGPGTLYWAPLGTTEPASLTATLDAAWIQVGYTLQGSEFRLNPTSTDLYVEEEFEPVRVVTTQRQTELMFQLAESTLQNLKLINNGGTVSGGAFEPPDVGTEVDTMLLWDSEDSQERWLFRQGRQAGQVSAQHRKGALEGYQATFRFRKPDSGSKTYKVWMTAGRAA